MTKFKQGDRVVPERFEDTEIWKVIPGWEDKYMVSNHGRVCSLGWIKVSNGFGSWKRLNGNPLIARNDIIRKPYLFRGCYHYIVLGATRGPIQKCYPVHTLVAIAFLKKPEYANQVNHIDGNKLNNHVDNLEWVNASENTLHYTMRNKKLFGSNSQKKDNSFVSKLRYNNIDYYLGTYKSPEEAHIAYIMGSLFLNCKNKYLSY